MRFRTLLAGILVGLGICLCSCGQKDAAEGRPFSIYYLNMAQTRMEIVETTIPAENSEHYTAALLELLTTSPDSTLYKAPFNMGFTVLNHSIDQGKLLLNMDAAYLNMSPTTEPLVRAAIVMTMLQDPEINFVGITVEGNTLLDSLSQVVGWMNADQFINNTGSEINNYVTGTMTLYFANATGDGLIMVNRSRLYNSNISLEKLVVEELIKGPDNPDVYPTINPATRIISVTVKDSICYVNLDDQFLTRTNNIKEEIAIYSIVNSLAELGTVNKVQIIINDSATGVFLEKYSFDTIYERNLDLVVPKE